MYGIPNCDIVKKAMSWLKKNEIPFELHDYKKQGISEQKLKSWCKLSGWESLFNKRSTTWRELQAQSGTEVKNEADAIKIMQQNTSIIKRPVIEINNEIIVGYDENAYLDKILKK
ncbi:MAG: Spx/MgsR family RNA polymerase-binding regulatory protein, partial [Sphingobacteriaceae bacterium]